MQLATRDEWQSAFHDICEEGWTLIQGVEHYWLGLYPACDSTKWEFAGDYYKKDING